jgi:hypothetical protein
VKVRWALESSAGFGGKAKVCSTDWLAKVCKLPADQQEVEYFSKLASKDPKAHSEAKPANENSNTENVKIEVKKRPSKIVIENAILAMVGKINAKSAHADELKIACDALSWALGNRNTIAHGVVTLFDPMSDKVVEDTKK